MPHARMEQRLQQVRRLSFCCRSTCHAGGSPCEQTGNSRQAVAGSIFLRGGHAAYGCPLLILTGNGHSRRVSFSCRCTRHTAVSPSNCIYILNKQRTRIQGCYLPPQLTTSTTADMPYRAVTISHHNWQRLQQRTHHNNNGYFERLNLSLIHI